jgi:hypothetical protein
MSCGKGVVTGLALLGQVEPEWESLKMTHGHEGLCSLIVRGVETLGVHVMLLFMGGPLIISLRVGVMLGVYQCQ